MSKNKTDQPRLMLVKGGQWVPESTPQPEFFVEKLLVTVVVGKWNGRNRCGERVTEQPVVILAKETGDHPWGTAVEEFLQLLLANAAQKDFEETEAGNSPVPPAA